MQPTPKDRPGAMAKIRGFAFLSFSFVCFLYAFLVCSIVAQGWRNYCNWSRSCISWPIPILSAFIALVSPRSNFLLQCNHCKFYFWLKLKNCIVAATEIDLTNDFTICIHHNVNNSNATLFASNFWNKNYFLSYSWNYLQISPNGSIWTIATATENKRVLLRNQNEFPINRCGSLIVPH